MSLLCVLSSGQCWGISVLGQTNIFRGGRLYISWFKVPRWPDITQYFPTATPKAPSFVWLSINQWFIQSALGGKKNILNWVGTSSQSKRSERIREPAWLHSMFHCLWGSVSPPPLLPPTLPRLCELSCTQSHRSIHLVPMKYREWAGPLCKSDIIVLGH